ncbi:hypothetical protein H4R34_004323 [Dimargaris verticillata]|uniref:histone acetyltransferase n=1 Tax=Dimargaris verticillata TaxID=2761393 RepID=A0A9W8AYG6_9FUNG|nr:hypothetical protein H4R34_004323 [Dimargaris verticillata]
MEWTLDTLLSRHLSAGPWTAASRIVGHAFKTKPHICPALYHPSSSASTLPNNPAKAAVVKRLLLLSQGSLVDPVLVAGLMAYEYYTPKDSAKPVLVYIEKVDTAGTWVGSFLSTTAGATATGPPLTPTLTAAPSTPAPAPNPVRSVVYAYMDFCLAKYGLQRTVEFHVCARPQPEYLFANSKANPAKHVLDDRALVRWWHRTLSQAYRHQSHKVSWHGYWYVPGLAASEAKWLLAPPTVTLAADTANRHTSATTSALSHDAENTDAVEWIYGLPADPKLLACEAIPQFPDDPRTRLLAKPGADQYTVHEFHDMLAIGEECGAGRRTGFFVIKATPPESSFGGKRFFAQDLRWCTVSSKGWEAMLVQLFHTSMDFATVASAQRSSRRFFQWMKRKFGLEPLHLALAADVPTSSPLLKATPAKRKRGDGP